MLIILAVCSFLTSCKKDLNPSNEAITSQKEEKIKYFADVKANVSVSDGVLTFEKSQDLTRTINFLRNASKEEIAKWEESLGHFESLSKMYIDSKNELMAVETDTDYKQWKAKFSDKVILEKDGIISPLIETGIAYGRIIGVKKMYKIGKTIVLYHGNKVISILDGDINKVEIAKQYLTNDTSKGIFMHDLKIKSPQDAQKNGLTVRSVCPNSCNPSVQLTRQANEFRLRVRHDVYDNSSFLPPGPYCNDIFFLKVDVEVSMQVDLEKKRWYGWAGDRSGFEWNGSWNISMYSAAATNGSQIGGQRIGSAGWLSYEAFLNYSEQLFSGEGCTTEVAYVLGEYYKCINQIGLTATSNPVSSKNTRITTEVKCQR